MVEGGWWVVDNECDGDRDSDDDDQMEWDGNGRYWKGEGRSIDGR